MAEYGSVKHGSVGIMVQDLNPSLAQSVDAKPLTKGALISSVIKNSTLYNKIKPKDIITEINNVPINTSSQLKFFIGVLREGENIVVKALRGEKEITVKGKLISYSALNKDETGNLKLGARLINYDELSNEGEIIKGVGIISVNNNSPAWLSGLQPYDVITNMNNAKISNITDLYTFKNIQTNQKSLY